MSSIDSSLETFPAMQGKISPADTANGNEFLKIGQIAASRFLHGLLTGAGNRWPFEGNREA
ncbi:MAG: hypothetical protein KGZ31_00085 [Sulfuritalea sp.]|nr:hypothetical protein [Sulfuritalea sp.]